MISLYNINELYKNYLMNDRRLKENSVIAYASDAESFVSYLKQLDLDINDITNTHVLGYVYKLQRSDVRFATVNRRISSLKRFFKFMRQEGIIEFDIDYKFKLVNLEKKIDYLSTEEFENIVSAIKTGNKLGLRDRTIMEIFIATGLKSQELIDLKPSDINLILGSINIFNGENSRTIPLTERAQHWLKQYMQSCKTSEFLFETTHKKPMSRQSIHKIMSKYRNLVKAEHELSPQLLRNSMAIWLVKNGIDAFSLQKLLGHTDIKSVEKYFEEFSNNDMLDTLIEKHPLQSESR